MSLGDIIDWVEENPQDAAIRIFALERENIILERENAELREENAEWREMIREAVFDNNDILYWIRGARSILLDAVEKDRAAYAARKEAQP